jgi:AraC-like DNA-binding protein
MTLEALAAHAHMPPNYLVHLFTRTVGLPTTAYLQRRRLELATRLLIHSDLLAGEVGDGVGWSDANYFTRRFRAEFGVTPTGYRERRRQGIEVSAHWVGPDS